MSGESRAQEATTSTTASHSGTATAVAAATATAISTTPAAREPAVAPAHEAVCENCAAPVTGPFCAQCGQRHGHSIQSAWHFIREATEDLTHTDSRLWQTLWALLARPGALTREFLDGHRVRYLPPLRLYLVVSLAFFVLAGLAAQHGGNVVRIENGPRHGFSITRAPAADAARADVTLTSAQVDEVCPEMASGLVHLSPGLLSRLEQPLTSSCHKFLTDAGASWYEQFLRNMERVLFVFLPVLALFAWLLYWRPRHYYVEHLLFFVHNHAFLFLLLSLHRLVALASATAPVDLTGLVGLAVWGYIPWYLYRSMRTVYGQGKMLTLVKFLALVCIYGVTGVVAVLGTALYSVLTL
jgi:hypothetical protein